MNDEAMHQNVVLAVNALQRIERLLIDIDKAVVRGLHEPLTTDASTGVINTAPRSLAQILVEIAKKLDSPDEGGEDTGHLFGIDQDISIKPRDEIAPTHIKPEAPAETQANTEIIQPVPTHGNPDPYVRLSGVRSVQREDVWQHRTGTRYVVTGLCVIEATWDVGVMYRPVDAPSEVKKTPIIRPLDEFTDGRFTLISRKQD